MDTKWVPMAQNGMRIPSFCISHRDLSHGGLPEAQNQLSKFGCPILENKKAPAGTPAQKDRICNKINLGLFEAFAGPDVIRAVLRPDNIEFVVSPDFNQNCWISGFPDKIPDIKVQRSNVISPQWRGYERERASA